MFLILNIYLKTWCLTGGFSMPPGDARTNTKERKKSAIFQPQRVTGFSMRPEPPRCGNILKPLKQSVLDRLRWRNQKARRADHNRRCRMMQTMKVQSFNLMELRNHVMLSRKELLQKCLIKQGKNLRNGRQTIIGCKQNGSTKNNEACLSSSWS